MPKWTTIAETKDCPPGRAIECVAGDRIVALYNVDGEFYALDGVCPHQGGPLGDGALQGCIVTCPWHGWQFDVRTGQNQLSAKMIQPKFALKVEGTSVLVDLETGV